MRSSPFKLLANNCVPMIVRPIAAVAELQVSCLRCASAIASVATIATALTSSLNANTFNNESAICLSFFKGKEL